MLAYPRLDFSTIPLDTLRTTYLDNPFKKGMYGIHISYQELSPYGNHGILFPHEENRIKKQLT